MGDRIPNKQIVFTREFVKRLVERGLLEAFDYDLEKAKKSIEELMRNKSVVIDSLSERYIKQKRCLIELGKFGLTKIPFSETEKFVVSITIANPVTDPRCKTAFRLKSEKDKRGKSGI